MDGTVSGRVEERFNGNLMQVRPFLTSAHFYRVKGFASRGLVGLS
jgi:hypothetical protein